jgi:hypothetical protein
MAISGKTLNEIREVINEWAGDKSLTNKDIGELFDKLSKVNGNGSFKVSIEMLKCLYPK